MAIIQNTIRSTQAAATNTTSVAATVALPQNAHTLIIYNPDGTNSVYVSEGTASASAIPAAQALIVPANSSVTLGIGTQTMRGNPLADFIFSTSAGTISVTITYICTNTI